MEETKRTLTFHVKTLRCFSAFLRRRLRDVDVLELCEAVSLEISQSFLPSRMTDEMPSFLVSTFFSPYIDGAASCILYL
jgi:hypothetical protein